MADIELVIKVPEGLKKDFESEQWTALSCMEMKNALMNGIPLPKGHGDLIDRNEVKKLDDKLCIMECVYCTLKHCFYHEARPIIKANKAERSIKNDNINI